MNKKVYYKVVGVTGYNADLTSSYAGLKYRAKYAVNQVTKSTGTPLFIFDSIKSAEAYACGARCYACHATNVRKPYSIITDHINYFDLYWQLVREARAKHVNISKYIEEHTSSISKWMVNPMKGTLWCDSIKLLHKAF